MAVASIDLRRSSVVRMRWRISAIVVSLSSIAGGGRVADRPRLLIDHFRSEVPTARAENRASEIEPLAGWPHPRRLELAADHGVVGLLRGACRIH
jgi:hypothetical protein